MYYCCAWGWVRPWSISNMYPGTFFGKSKPCSYRVYLILAVRDRWPKRYASSDCCQKKYIKQVIIKNRTDLVSHPYCIVLDIRELSLVSGKYSKIRVVNLYNNKIGNGCIWQESNSTIRRAIEDIPWRLIIQGWVLILGDMNAHNSMWNSHCQQRINPGPLEELIESYELIVNNDTKFPTHPSSLGISIIDLALTSTNQLDWWVVSQQGKASRGQAELPSRHRHVRFGDCRARLPFGHRRVPLGDAELRRGDGSWRKGERRYKEGGRRIQEGIKFTFAVAIATPISHFVFCISHFALCTLHFAFCTLHPLLLSFALRLLYLAFPILPLHVSVV